MPNTVLFVDDHPDILRGLKRMLRGMRDQWEMVFVESGEEAIKTFEKQDVDVIVSDMRMPKMDGAELLSLVRDRYPKTVRIILSGYSDYEAIYRTVGPAHQYLAKPCDADALVDTVTRALGLREFLGSSELRLLVAKMDRLPALPDVYKELVSYLEKEEASAAGAAKILNKDVAMATQLMKLTNSAFFGLPTLVKSTLQAIQILGFETVKSLVLVVGIFSQVENDPKLVEELEHLSERSNRIGSIAKAIAVAEGCDDMVVDQAGAAGILSHIGSLLLAVLDFHKFKESGDMVGQNGVNIVEAERKLFGSAHPEVGAYLLGLWGFRDPVVEAVAFHHNPKESSCRKFDVIAILHAAQFLSHRSLDDAQDGSYSLDLSYFEEIGKADRLKEWEEIAKKAGTAEDAA